MTAIAIRRPRRPGFKISEWIFTTDHKRIGILYLIGSMAAFMVAGLMAIGIRLEQMSMHRKLAWCNYFVGDFGKNLTTAERL